MPSYFPHVDGLRALAVLAVMAYHLHPSLVPGGFVGVDVFFVISGFVVTASLARHGGESLVAFLGLFYARRLARIMPALLVMLLATTAAYVLFIPPTWLSGITESVASAAFWGFSNWVLGEHSEIYFAPRAEFNPFLHTWSLGVEEQFYLVAPLLLFGWIRWRTQSNRRKLAVVAMCVLALMSIAAVVPAALRYGPLTTFYGLIFRFWELATGVLWFQLAAERGVPSKNSRSFLSMGVWLGLVLVVLTLALARPQAFPWPWLGAVIGAAFLIGNPYAPPNDPVRWCFARPTMVWIGQRSYSLYLWHWPVFVLFRWTVGLETWPLRLLALSLAVLIATASYRWIERPFRKSPALNRLPPGFRVAGSLVVVALCWGTATAIMGKHYKFGLTQAGRNFDDWYVTDRMVHGPSQARVCEPRIIKRRLDVGEVIEYLPENCRQPGATQLFVLGDSHATAYLPMFDQLSAEQGRIVRVYAIPGCSYVDLMNPMDHIRTDLPRRMAQSRQSACLRGARDAMNDVMELGRRGDIVFLPSLRLQRYMDQWGPVASRPVDRAAALDDAPRWFVPFQRAGLSVVFEAPKPIFRVPIFRCVDPFNSINPQCAIGFSEARQDLEAYRAATLDAITSLSKRHPEIHIWDPLPTLCPGARCEPFQEGRPLYFDADHVSAYGNFVLLPSFKQALEPLWAAR